MVAIRETLQVKNHHISYTLPKSFNYDEIEMIILPKIDELLLSNDEFKTGDIPKISKLMED